MKIKQLINKLNKLNPNSEVILSSDAEGNSFSFLDTNGIYDTKYHLYCGEINLCDDQDIKELNIKGAKNCVVLFPD